MDNISNKLFYEKSIKEFGVSAQGVHWNSKYTQYKRFEIITKLIKKEIMSSSVVDAGCGFGEYFSYLIKNNKKPRNYIGIDCEDYMINNSKRRYPYTQFSKLDILKDSLPMADFYISSGGLNILKYNDVKLFVEKCFYSSNKGFIFNFLKDVTFTNVTQNDIINICLSLSDKIIIKENYLENDFTIFLKKALN